MLQCIISANNCPLISQKYHVLGTPTFATASTCASCHLLHYYFCATNYYTRMFVQQCAYYFPLYVWLKLGIKSSSYDKVGRVTFSVICLAKNLYRKRFWHTFDIHFQKQTRNRNITSVFTPQFKRTVLFRIERKS